MTENEILQRTIFIEGQIVELGNCNVWIEGETIIPVTPDTVIRYSGEYIVIGEYTVRCDKVILISPREARKGSNGNDN